MTDQPMAMHQLYVTSHIVKELEVTLRGHSITGQHTQERSLSMPCPLIGYLVTPPAVPTVTSVEVVEPGGIEPPTPCLQSRCSPS